MRKSKLNRENGVNNQPQYNYDQQQDQQYDPQPQQWQPRQPQVNIHNQSPKKKKGKVRIILYSILGIIILTAFVQAVRESTGHTVDPKNQEEPLKIVQESKKENQRQAQETTTEKEDPIEQLTNSYTYKNVTMTALSSERSDGKDFSKPSEGKEFVNIKISVDNDGKKEFSLNPYHFEVKTDNGEILTHDFSATVAFSEQDQLGSMKLAPGGKTEKNIAFEIPKDSYITLIYKGNMFGSAKFEILVP